ncbi:MAG TPA: AraC family transcriptional regulator [Thermoanaerobaculia bacterium]|nr:AraC family transcriptional regulator [Thermoanaerobaculia bacterium]
MPQPVSQVVQLRDAGGFELSERVHQPAWDWAPHAHERASISLILAGSCVEQLGRFAYTCSPATMHVLPVGEPHSFRFDAPLRCLTIEVVPARAAALREVSRILEGPRQLRDAEYVSIGRQLATEMRIADDASELALESLILGLLARAGRASGSTQPPRWLLAVRDILHAEFREKVGLAALARVAGVDPSHLARAFRRQYGCTVGAYVRRLRLDFAAAELRHAERSISDVAAEAGFFDQSHFARLFRRHTGLTPTAFRAAQKSN